MLLSHRRLDTSGCLDKALMPQLKHQQRPKQFAMIGHAAFVFVLQTSYIFRIEHAGPAHTFWRQQDRALVGEVSPSTTRPPELQSPSCLVASQSGGNDIFHRSLENVFGLPASQLVVCGQASGKLRHARIEKRRAHFERHCHACAIHFRQDVFRKIKPRVDALHALDDVCGVTLFRTSAARGDRYRCRWSLRTSRSQQLVLLVRRKRTKPNMMTRNRIVFCAGYEPESPCSRTTGSSSSPATAALMAQ